MEVASRNPLSRHESDFIYFYKGRENVMVKEDGTMVDGIGGSTWDGSIVLCKFLEGVFFDFSSHQLDILELGCGTGLCGVIAALLGGKVIVSDRYIDLAIYNKTLNKSLLLDSKGSLDIAELSWAGSSFDNASSSKSNDDIHGRKFDIIIGAEIVCLRKQQQFLVNTIFRFSENKENVLIFLTFDDVPSNGAKSQQEMLQLMKEAKFLSSVVHTGLISWRKTPTDSGFLCSAFYYDITEDFLEKSSRLALPTEIVDSKIKLLKKKLSTDSKVSDTFDSMEHKCDRSKMPPIPPAQKNKNSRVIEESTHHIVAFYKPSAVNTCKRCNKQFFWCNPALNPYNACRFHTGLYVCRKHPGDTRSSIDGQGDQLGYYGDGSEGWAAEFWDCCGSEDPKAMGCSSAPHVSYS